LKLKDYGLVVKKVIVGDLNFKISPNGVIVNIGSIRFGQSLDFIIELNTKDEIMFDGLVTYQNSNLNMQSASKLNFDKVDQNPFLAEKFRLETVSTLK